MSRHCRCTDMLRGLDELSAHEPFGEFCSDLSRTLRYQPESSTYASCWETDLSDLTKRILSVQHPSYGLMGSEGVVKAPANRNEVILPEDGFGVIIRFTALRLRQHVKEGMQMALSSLALHISPTSKQEEASNFTSGIYYDAEYCQGAEGSHWLQCYFEELSDPAPTLGNASNKSNKSEKTEMILTDDRNCKEETGADSCPSCGELVCPQKWEPGHGVFKLGRFLENAVFLDTVWRLNVKTKALIQQTQAIAGLTTAMRPMLSMHIRHGDSCRDELHLRECMPAKAFLDAAEGFKTRYGAKSIFVASDDAGVIAEVRELGPKYGWKQVIALDLKRNKYEVETMGEWSKGADMALDAIAEIESLASGDMFVGQFSSNVARLAFSLMVKKKGFFPPFESLDIPYCDHFGRDDPVPWAGEFMARVPFFC